MGEIQIETACPDDAAELLAIYAPYVRETAITFEYDVPTQAEFESRIRNTLQKYPYVKAVRGSEILGYAYASPLGHRAAYAWSAETSIYVRQDARGNGIGKRLYAALEDGLRARGITNAYACITFPNPESISFHEREGYVLAGHFHRCGYKFDRWLDVVWMEKFL